jgi:catechol 2,3-dioxygenase-like lactoylglutathione lyase family enzyme
MYLHHVGLTCRSEEKADTFYVNLLGLKKSEPKILPVDLSSAIFGIASELKIINYTGQSVQFEIFIYGSCQNSHRPIDHICLQVENLEELLQKCRREDVNIIRIPKGESLLTFIRDFDGNLYEIKEERNRQ